MRGAVAAIGPTFVSFKVAVLDLEKNYLFFFAFIFTKVGLRGSYLAIVGAGHAVVAHVLLSISAH